jgi:Bacterial Ig-like domain (group 3)/FG-GAP-like repeat/FG-GAP repeat
MRKPRLHSLFSIWTVRVGILTAVAGLCVSSQAAPVHFTNAITYNLDAIYGQSVAVADLNGDGHPDLVVAGSCQDNPCIGHVSVLLANGDGSFQSPMTYSLLGIPGLSVAVGDINGDGNPDLVVAGGWEFAVLLGNGNGTFQPPEYSIPATDWYATEVSIADLNRDGKPDVVFSCTALSQAWAMEVLLANGDGTFQTAAMYDTGVNSPWKVTIADVNGDGYPDAIMPGIGRDSFGAVGVLLGNGDGTFRPAVTYHTSSNSGVSGSATSAAVADVNGDGKPDIVASNPKTLGVLLGNGDGSFQTPADYAGGFPYSIAAADLNGDGKPDIVGGGGSDTVGVLLGNGDGSFGKLFKFSTGGWVAMSVAIADVNADSKPDVLVANLCADLNTCWSGGGSSVSVLLNDFTAKTSTAIISSLNPSFVGQPVTFTATVNSNPAVPDGQTVSFYDGLTMLASVAITGGTATYSTSSLSGKKHNIQAKYAGDLWHKPSTGTVLQVVQKYPTTTSLVSTPNPSNYGQTVTFTATVTQSGPYGVTGKVKFFDGTTGIGSATLSAGVATLKKSTLALGTHAIMVQYLSDAYNDKSTSPVVNQVVK